MVLVGWRRWDVKGGHVTMVIL